MNLFDAATVTYLTRRGGMVAHLMAYFWAANRETGAVESIGLWTGTEDRVFQIDGTDRVYLRVAGMMDCDEISGKIGHDVMMTELRLSMIDDSVRLALRAYDARFAPVELHRALFDPVTEQLIAPPHRLVRGWVNQAPLPTSEIGGSPVAKVQIASSARALTIALPAVKTDGATSNARSGDRFRRYQDPAGSVQVVWGGARY